MSQSRSAADLTAESYYDSVDADTFYETVWGGEDIHIGLYDEASTPIPEASKKTVALMGDQLDLRPGQHVIDLGAGYGGSARYLARRFGCSVDCLNISERQNERNRQLNQAQKLSDLVSVTYGSFEAVPSGDGCADLVWSQDAFLHSGDRLQVLKEVNRLLKPGGELIFTDPMQADNCPPDVLQPVYDRLSLSSLGSFAYYRRHLAELGFEEVRCIELTDQLRNHYARVAGELQGRRDELGDIVSQEYIERMLTGLGNWVSAADNGHLAWGILHFRKT